MTTTLADTVCAMFNSHRIPFFVASLWFIYISVSLSFSCISYLCLSLSLCPSRSLIISSRPLVTWSSYWELCAPVAPLAFLVLSSRILLVLMSAVTLARMWRARRASSCARPRLSRSSRTWWARTSCWTCWTWCACWSTWGTRPRWAGPRPAGPSSCTWGTVWWTSTNFEIFV